MRYRCICEGCLFADWDRTSNGRLHPNKMGTCTWKKTVRVPPSYRGSVMGRHTPGAPEVLSAGRIERGQYGFKACDVYQPK